MKSCRASRRTCGGARCSRRSPDRCVFRPRAGTAVRSWRACRSEEHTSELQSQSNLVCRLLLEKKKVSYQRHLITLTRVRERALAALRALLRPALFLCVIRPHALLYPKFRDVIVCYLLALSLTF